MRKTYQTLVRDWGVRYIKMDFMDDTAIEGKYFRPDTSALQAQRIGLGIIRQTIGNGVLLDKDGSVMLNPVGFVDFGRISQDTGHTFEASSEAVSGIAARYFMNRNYFVADPDAFSVSRQTVDDQAWHNSTKPLTQDEAEVSIALAAVSGGMYEIGDDLPTLGSEPDRLALVQNQDLIDMVRLGKSSTPLDLMSYLPNDLQPSIFLAKREFPAEHPDNLQLDGESAIAQHYACRPRLGRLRIVHGDWRPRSRAGFPLGLSSAHGVAAAALRSSAENYRHSNSSATTGGAQRSSRLSQGRRDDFLFS